jgi:ribosomal subunit interface protein
LKKGEGMLIETKALGFSLTEAIQRHAELRIETALGPFAQAVVGVTVRLRDVNANRCGVDKRCSVVVTLRRRGMITAEETHADLYVAIDTVAQRLRRAVKRAVKRRLTKERKDPQRPGALATM